MADGIKLEGIDEFISFIDSTEITQEDEAKAIRKAMNNIKKYVEPKAPRGATERTKKSLKVKIRKTDFSTEGVLYVDSWYAMFQEFRNSKQKGNYVGWFERGVSDASNVFMEILNKELLK